MGINTSNPNKSMKDSLNELECNELIFKINNVQKTQKLISSLKQDDYPYIKKLVLDFNEDIFDQFYASNTNPNQVFQSNLVFYPCELEELEMMFMCCHGLENKTVTHFMKTVPNTLKSLQLNLFNCSGITDKCIEQVCLYLPRSLQRLSINLGDCTKITQYSLYSIVNFLKKAQQRNQQIKCLELKFSWNEKITDQCFEQLIEAIDQKIQVLKISLPNCKNISTQSYKVLYKNIGKFTSLEHLGINLLDTSNLIGSNSQKILDSLPYSLKSCSLKFNKTIDPKIKQILEQRFSQKYISSQSTIHSQHNSQTSLSDESQENNKQ
ncbi:hypothetical protein PPERSA_06021 [Pseudocohnilembus persalinus]|uniref:Uncharacterized protein n=1 Tax=Pseudocohnilembus persalinus TaxID=266149 RepID=A0A0V0QQE4_PSEPJ|nr:hypothetical protein PPERSA_06021 [Pseudocohnilembus persalinus]|eukprot:KRX04468.1 hypothetical protein PPERSA_06021 [Pseudocohnilembus persalinus]